MATRSVFAPALAGAGLPGSGSGGLWELLSGSDASPAHAEEQPDVEAVPWDALMRRHNRRVVVSLLARGIGPERAKEIAQDAWMRVIAQHRAGRLVDLRIPGIVIAQASFLARDDQRRHQRRAQLNEPTVAMAANPTPQQRDLERQIDARRQLQRVMNVVDRAAPNARRVFALLYGEGAMTPAEVADTLGLSVQRVRQILCELRKQIRTELGGQHG